MSILIVDQLSNAVPISQDIKVSRDVSVACIRPWIYVNGTLADGDFQCRVLQGVTELAVVTINYADINAVITETYAHGYIRFDFNGVILHRAEGETDTEYTLEFSMINHTNDGSNYLGLVREWDARSAEMYGDVDINGDPVNDQISAFGYQIYEYRSI